MKQIERDERGAYLVLWALLMVGLLMMVAIVVDLGQLRDTKRQAQLVADLSGLAAGRKLAGTVNSSGTLSVDSRGACTEAFEYIKTNLSDLPATASMTGAGGCIALPTACINDDPLATPPATGTPAGDAVAAGSGPYTLTIRYPVWDSEIADPRLPGVRDSDGKMCERMMITIQRGRKTLFAGVAGIGNVSTAARAVIRGFGNYTPNHIPALAMLERVGCGVLFTSSASPSAHLIIKAINPNNPGVIQADSYGVPSQGGCDNNASGPAQRTNKIIFGKADSSGNPSIHTEDCLYFPPITPTSTCDPLGTSTTPGQVALNSLRAGSIFGAWELGTPCPGSTCGVRSTLGPGEVVSRRVVDDKYLTEVQALKTSSDTLLNQANNVGFPTGRADLVTSGYKIYPDAYGVSCGQLPVAVAPAPPITEISDPKVLVNETCDLNPTTSSNELKFTGTDFIVAGKISVGSGKTLTFTNAKQLLIAGCAPVVGDRGTTNSAGCGNSPSSGSNTGINLGGTLRVNSQSAAVGTCPADSTTYLPGALVLRSGRIDTSTASFLDLCQVFVYMSGLKPAANGISQSNLPSDHASCATPPVTTPPTPALPCPIDTTSYAGFPEGYRAYTEIQGSVTWLAPNQSPLTPRVRTDPDQKFEDLALWMEGSTNSAIKGTGNTNTTGLFFFPNATFTFQGQSCTTPRDAQFFSRRLELSGTSCFIMQPLPQNAIFTPRPSFTLIR